MEVDQKTIVKEYIFNDKLSVETKLKFIVGSTLKGEVPVNIEEINGCYVVSILRNIKKLVRVYNIKNHQLTKIEVTCTSSVATNHLDATRLFYKNCILRNRDINFFIDKSGNIILDNIHDLTNEDLYLIYTAVNSLKR